MRRSNNLTTFQMFRIPQVRTIVNASKIMPQIGNMLMEPPNSVEYILAMPAWRHIKFSSFFFKNGSESSFNPFGHSVIRYNLNGNDTIMNISGKPGTQMANFFKTEDYLFNDEIVEGDEQGGVFNRSYVGIRLENVPIVRFFI